MLENVYDIVFIGKDTAPSMSSYNRLLERFPTAKRSIITDSVHAALSVALKKSFTSMVWIVWDDIEIDSNFNFDFKVDAYDQQYIHTFLNIDKYNGVALFPKNAVVSKREAEYRFYVTKKEIPIIASRPKQYDIVFMSYNEPHADENFQRLQTQFPTRDIYRVHGIKGIHNAHRAAANLVSTDMFWVVDADAVILDDFSFNYEKDLYFDTYRKKTVHVWRSQNPINGLVYGYGGVKLLPTKLTQTVGETTPDMTTSISPQFCVVDEISNITAFNTDAFSTWRSAFRECVKLSSKVIDRQNYQETTDRLNAWLTYYPNKPFAQEAADGAYDGREYGRKNAADPAALALINDFDWLKNRFEQTR